YWLRHEEFPDHVLTHRMRTVRYLYSGHSDSVEIANKILDCKKAFLATSPSVITLGCKQAPTLGVSSFPGNFKCKETVF
ncbi:MAG: hypothetical protein VCF07_02175, partial [Nitrospinota bacterium]